jgi:hypothetical protein
MAWAIDRAECWMSMRFIDAWIESFQDDSDYYYDLVEKRYDPDV